MAMYDNVNTVRASFDLNYISEYLLQAQWAEFIELKKVISEIAERNNQPVTIMDIGIGNARIPKHLCGIKDIWDKVAFMTEQIMQWLVLKFQINKFQH